MMTRQSKARSSASFIIDGFAHNIYTPVEDKSPVVVGISTTNRSLNFDDIYCEIGYPYDDFRGVSDTNTVCIACGYQFPVKRLEILREKAQRVIVTKGNLELNKIGGQVITQKVIPKNNVNNRDLILSFLND